MRQILLSAILAVLLSGRATPQDMPLSQILVDGEGWRPGTGDLATRGLTVRKNLGIQKPVCNVLSPDGGTLFVGSEMGMFIWAFRVEKDGSLTAGQPYCPLRSRVGDKDVPVAKLATDKVGRIYATTSLGIQIFDPTGRLCGVIDNPPGGPVNDMDFEVRDDQLCVFNKNGMYLRKLKAGSTARPRK